MKPDKIGLKRLDDRIELRIHGWGDTGKGDRWTLLSGREARKLAYSLLVASEDLNHGKEVAA